MRTSLMRAPSLFLPLLAAALGVTPVMGQSADTQVSSDETVFTGNRTIAAGEVVEDIVVVGGDLRVIGEVTEDAVVVGGNLILEPTGVIGGDATVTGGEFRNEGGSVGGEMRTLSGPGLDIAREIQRAVAGSEAVVESERRDEPRVVTSSPPPRREERRNSFFGPIRRGFAGIISTFALGLVLAGIGSALVFYARPYLETVSDTVRGSTIRAGATGLAASFLAIPAFVILIVALVVSIIGIPFLLIAVPLYPVALVAAAVYGLLAVTHAIGERTAEQSRDGLNLRYRNSYAYLLTGVAMLLLPHVAAHMISMAGFLGFIGTLLKLVTWVAIWAAATVGFGAVILSRGGTRRTFATPQPDSAYLNDDLFGDDPIGVDNV